MKAECCRLQNLASHGDANHPPSSVLLFVKKKEAHTLFLQVLKDRENEPLAPSASGSHSLRHSFFVFIHSRRKEVDSVLITMLLG